MTRQKVTSVKKNISSAEKRKPSAFWLLASAILPLWRLSAKYVFTPESRLPQSGPFILCPNHMSELDPVAVGAAVWRLGRVPRFMAKASLFKVPVLGWLMRATGQIPVERSASRHKADPPTTSVRSSAPQNPMSAASELTVRQGGVIIYPEGTLTRDPDMWPMRGKSGAVRLALEEDIPLYPAAHWGVQQIMPRYSKKLHLFRRKTIKIAVGDPLDLSKYRGRAVTQELIREITAELMDEITKLLETLRGKKAPAQRWDPRKHNQSESGRF